MASRRLSDTAGVNHSGAGDSTTPHLKVVGFHVEGVSNSPAPHSPGLSSSILAAPTGGSPTPVLIPPSFPSEATAPGAATGAVAPTSPYGKDGPEGAAVAQPPAPIPSLSPLSSGGIEHPSAAPAGASPKRVASSELSRIEEQAHRSSNLTASSACPDGPQAGSAEPITPTGTQAEPATASLPAAHATMPPPPPASASKELPAPPTAAPGGAAEKATAKPDKAEKAKAKGAQQRGPPPEPKPKLSKAERRELQERQRAEKEARKAEESAGKGEGGKTQQQKSVPKSAPKAAGGGGGGGSGAGEGADVGKGRATAAAKSVFTATRSTDLFAHLQQHQSLDSGRVLALPEAAGLHPNIIRLGVRYADGTIKGGNARTAALLAALADVVRDYKTPQGKSLSRDLTPHVNQMIAFLALCRPLCVGMGNAIRWLKGVIMSLDPSMPDKAAKASIVDDIETYVQEKIVIADQELIKHAAAKINNGDVVLTYAYSSVVYSALLAAQGQGKTFTVVIVDSRPHNEGRALLKKLLSAGIHCQYALINALSYVIRDCTKVFLGASAVLANGTVLGRLGSAAVAMAASASHRPVLVCAETYKFNERVQLDSITSNEIGDPHLLESVPGRPDLTALKGWDADERIALLNLTYDLMPAAYVTLIVTELGLIPPTSVPVVLREFSNDAAPGA